VVQTDRAVKSGGWRAWTWWSALALMAAHVVTVNGAESSPFSGLPLSSRATVLFLGIVVLGIFTAMFPPHRRAGLIWPGAILVLLIARVFLAPSLITPGWKGLYQSAYRITPTTFGPLNTAWFQNRGPAARPYRTDAAIDFDGSTFGLSFMNEISLDFSDYAPVRRTLVEPLVVHWTGHVYATERRPLAFTISGRGHLTAGVDGRRVLDTSDPRPAAVAVPVEAGPHVLSIVYVKPPGVEPLIRVATSETVTETAADPAQWKRSRVSRYAIDVLGLLSLLLLFGAFVDSYRPLRLLLQEMRARPDKLAALGVVLLFLAWGAYSLHARHRTFELGIGDDPLVYERDARWIARNGPMLLDDSGRGGSYFFYPLYSYGLALAHIVFGDDFSTIWLFNYICLACSSLLMWALLRNYLSRGALAFLLLVVFAPFAVRYVGLYARSAFSDNLFIPMVLLMLVACATAFERRSIGWLFVTGMLTAIAAATRASLMTHLAFVPLAVMLYRDFGSVPRRMRGSAAFVAGFAVALAPFTIRNWIVSRHFVLLVSSIVQMPVFLYDRLEDAPLYMNGHALTFVESLHLMVTKFSSEPLHVTWLEMRKLLFTLGFMQAGPDHGMPKFLFVLPILFALALWRRRVPKPMAATLLAFCGSHLLAMVMAAPWTYGYKTTLPFMFASMAGAAFLLRSAASNLPQSP